jgi:hypothetical protein
MYLCICLLKVLLANAWHHRSDALCSFVALLGIGGASLGLRLLDPIAAILVSVLLAANVHTHTHHLSDFLFFFAFFYLFLFVGSLSVSLSLSLSVIT